MGVCAYSSIAPHQGACQYHAGSYDLAIGEAINLVINMEEHCHIENGCLTLSDHYSYNLPFLGLHFLSAIPERVDTLGSKPFEFNWSNQRENVAIEN